MGNNAITCPVRFRQDWLVAEDAAAFFFEPNIPWTSLSEVRLRDKDGNAAGNIDLLLVSYDSTGRVIDFGSLEVQGVYISGNIRRPFQRYMQGHGTGRQFDWAGERNYPRPDYLSSSRKRLVPQLIYKGGILKTWSKKMAVAVDRGFYETLPALSEVDAGQADIVWLVYNLERDEERNLYQLVLHKKSTHTLQAGTGANHHGRTGASRGVY